MAASKGAGRYIKFKYVVKLLNKDNDKKDQSQEDHGAVTENHKGKKIQKGRVMGICACQDKYTKQNAGNSIMNVRNDQITASHKYKILVSLFVGLDFFSNSKYITAVFPTRYFVQIPFQSRLNRAF